MTIRNRLADQLREYERFEVSPLSLNSVPRWVKMYFVQDLRPKPRKNSTHHIDIDAYELLEIYPKHLLSNQSLNPRMRSKKNPSRFDEWENGF